MEAKAERNKSKIYKVQSRKEPSKRKGRRVQKDDELNRRDYFDTKGFRE